MIKGLRHPSTNHEWLVEFNGSTVQEQLDSYILNMIQSGPVEPQATTLYITLVYTFSSVFNIPITTDRIKKVIEAGIEKDTEPVTLEEINSLKDEDFVNTVVDSIYSMYTESVKHLGELI
jgi:phosphoribosylformylglycinamidine (FGAM) synthase PurS component